MARQMAIWLHTCVQPVVVVTIYQVALNFKYLLLYFLQFANEKIESLKLNINLAEYRSGSSQLKRHPPLFHCCGFKCIKNANFLSCIHSQMILTFKRRAGHRWWKGHVIFFQFFRSKRRIFYWKIVTIWMIRLDRTSEKLTLPRGFSHQLLFCKKAFTTCFSSREKDVGSRTSSRVWISWAKLELS